MASSNKTQRWIDLLAALLGRHVPIRFEEIAREVPAYLRAADPDCTPKEKASIKRTFERDKRELRALGVPLETIGEEGSEDTAYRIRTTDFYLPYLSLVNLRGSPPPKTVKRSGYRALATLTFDAEELRAVVEGAARAKQLGNDPLAADAQSALRKLAFDLPVGAVSAADDTRIAEPRARADARVLEVLAEALHRRRRVSFEYHSLEAGTTARRTVDPYGLFFLNAHWYLVAWDVGKDALRNFRVNRIRGVNLSSADKELPDYEIPDRFRLTQHARSRQAWELGDADATEVVVEFRGHHGATMAATSLGVADTDESSHRRFQVRRPEAFVRWLLSFAGEAVPISPPEIIAEWSRQIEATRALYRGSGSRTTIEEVS